MNNKPLHYLGVLIFLSAVLFTGCSSKNNPLPDNNEPIPNTEFDAIGTASSLDFATWNLEWFGDISEGPSNEQLQLDNIEFVISGLEADIWSVQEITSSSHFNTLLDKLDGYEGILANDPTVQSDSAYYDDFGGNEQKVGLVYKTDIITVNSAQVILTDYDHEFAGRPPVEFQLSATINNITQDFIVVLLHAKCCTDNESYERKQTGAEALKSYLDQTWPDAYVMVIGDFNDDVDTSITSSKSSAYQNFVDDSLNYIFPTKELSDAGISSTVSYPDVIDHHLTSNELYNFYIENSVISFPADDYVTNYGNTTSDHYPVLSQYTLQSGN
ncbi:MAG: endonuclease/exonuclease/phosphatase family protein [Gracilimonas sp.]|uniref:endonuclease/exonuclease/phosphatase family protein n=1 Tax=Gracilimonas sp. TaxID=1974203 RepID=UPI0019AC9816|nr:endonuclease/exonuclease/phosphatase family protein [Gracilimonas sp.]MBD3616933.1 endonuclease/exonuclease/phosphatase family protein [Gracilimonas sp.]